MRVALVGNFAPRKCGIATFTTDIFEQFAIFQPETQLDVYALQDPEDPVVHDRAHAEIRRSEPASYAEAARRMNEDGVDAVWLQHEFGIFGGDCGEQVLGLVERIAAPLIVTLHTVLSHPSAKQDAITRRLVARASHIMVMCQTGRRLLIERYEAQADRVSVIEHGAPDRPLRLSHFDDGGTVRRLMTFGLLGPGKGLETAIEALPAIVARHPEVVYRIVGVSHPNELRRHGEAYRQSLEALAESLGVGGHIEWVNRFLDTDELVAMLEDCDIYMTPYLNLQQATSGTLSYAVALGRAIVSTPYIHARELLSDTGGMLVEPSDAEAIAQAVTRLLDHQGELEALQLRTYRRGRQTIWRHFAANAKAMLETAVAPGRALPATVERIAPGLAAFDALCDGTGMLQHGHYAVPNRHHGYCLDDNVRALMLVNRVPWRSPGEELRRASTFASFLQYAWNPDAKRFRNFMNYDRSWCEDVGSEDSNGRAIWALGDTAAHSRIVGLRNWAAQGFASHAEIAFEFEAPRSIAFAALGAAALLEVDAGNRVAQAIVGRCGDMLEKLLCRTRRPDWTWFETVIGYDNPRLSQALIDCGRVSGRPAWIEAGLDSLRWVMANQCGAGGQFRPVGSESFGRGGDILPFDQQPLEAWAAIDACAAARRCDPASTLWLEHGRRAYRWFLGENDRNVPLADLQLGSCMDGVTPLGANQNVGAESLLAFQLAYYGFEQMLGCAGPDWREDAAQSHQG
ncbi:glycosyltransferase family 4 protein [Novosphingobium sp. JCM 18896]|uniref:glycosyltransferase family 4 protein n=1 Tax=Novosphingobium sp. JCM 18896 TaxID=2989731 RepID=UPI00222381A7|nr:glycosyltransferase family 4 protein [Novosphingobium sp. JCM 18896]MCW1429772.1 glycosyltransferase family 4 protein [Novosphingobium sp. JCM 18896]